VIQPDGGGLQTLVPYPAATPAWSPDGKAAAFGSPYGVEAVDADGSNRRTVAGGDLGVWSPDGTRIASILHFGCREPCSPGFEIHISNLGGGGAVSIFRSSDDSIPKPAWSPDGSKIAFSNSGAVWTVGPDGSAPGAVPNTTSGGSPDWSPDGSRIAFGRTVDGNADIYTIGPDGAGLTRLTTDPAGDITPAWSPEGSKIVFASTRADPNPTTCGQQYPYCNWELYTMDAAGGGQQRLTINLGPDTEPDWQPIPGPRRSDYKNGAQFCKADREFIGDDAFGERYGANGTGANAFGKCVSQSG
jgi:TolB protein